MTEFIEGMEVAKVDQLVRDLLICKGMKMSVLEILSHTEDDQVKEALYRAISTLEIVSNRERDLLPEQVRKLLGAWYG